MLVATDDLHPMGTCRTSSVGSGYRTSPANCDDPIRGSGSTGLSASLLVRLGIATSASLTGSMLVVTDDLHPMGTYRTLFQLVPNLIPVGSG